MRWTITVHFLLRYVRSHRSQVESLVQRKDASAQNQHRNTDSSAQSSDQKTANEDGVTDEVYTVYVSGIDTRGAMTSSSRSDVNIFLRSMPEPSRS